MVVGHSMGSAYATLVAATRAGSLLVHLCPRLGGLTPPPDAPSPFREGVPFPADRPDGTSVWEPDVTKTALYGRVVAEAAEIPGGHFPMAEDPDALVDLLDRLAGKLVAS